MRSVEEAGRPMSATALRRVERARVKLDGARRELEEAIQAANAVGVTLRPLARAAGLSVEWVRRIAKRQA
jgi:hypothetical protein